MVQNASQSILKKMTCIEKDLDSNEEQKRYPSPSIRRWLGSSLFRLQSGLAFGIVHHTIHFDTLQCSLSIPFETQTRSIGTRRGLASHVQVKKVPRVRRHDFVLLFSHRVRDNHKMERETGRARFFLTPSRQRLAQLRHHMGHFIVHLQIYIQHDVIEANFNQLKEDIQQTQDFMKAARRHEE